MSVEPVAGYSLMPEVVIYTRQYCSYCSAAKALLDRLGVPYVERDSTVDPAWRAEMIERAHGRGTFPQIFIGGQHVGGCDDLYDLHDRGRLAPLLAGSVSA
jgi:glutaredoxin 3